MNSADLSAVLILDDELIPRMRAVSIVKDGGRVALEVVNADLGMVLIETRSR